MDNVSRGQLRRLILWCGIALLASLLVGVASWVVVWRSTKMVPVAWRASMVAGTCALVGGLAMAGSALLASLLVGVASWVVVWRSTKMVPVAWRASMVAGTCALVGGLAMAGSFLLVERRRNARVAELAERVDLILRGMAGPQDLDDYDEGELAVLANELQKMCVLLRDQAEGLRKERDGLADELADISHQLRAEDVRSSARPGRGAPQGA